MPADARAIIRDEHRVLTAVLRSLQHLAREGARGDAELDHELFTVMLDYIDTFPNRFHHPKEDEHLFKALRRRTTAAATVLDESVPISRIAPFELTIPGITCAIPASTLAPGRLPPPETSVATFCALFALHPTSMSQERED